MAEGKKSIWKRVAKVAAWTIGGIVALTALVLCLLVWILTPSRLTPMVRDIAAEYIDGDLSLGKVELTVWSTFPKARIDIDSVAVRSAALDSAKTAFTAYSDTLLAFNHLHGGIDLSRLVMGEIRLTNVEIRALGVNALALDSTRTNFDILRIPADSTTEESEMTELPDISIERFAMLDSRPIRYVSIADSIDAALTLETQLTDDGTPVYRLSTGLKAGIDIAPGLSISDITINTDGRITWEHSRPYSIALDGFTIGVNEVPFKLSTAMDFTDAMRIDRLEVEMPATRATDILHAVPEGFKPQLPEIKSPLTIALKATLTEPYDIATDTIPTMDVTFDMPGGDVNFGNEFFIDDIALGLTAHVDGKNLDRSTVDVSRLYFRRLGTEFTVTGKGSRLLSDPKLKGTFDGSVDFDRLPPRLVEYIPGEVRGLLTAKSDFNFNLSDLTPNSFHRAKLSGEVTLKDFGFAMVDSVETRLYTRNAQLRLGTSDAFTTHSQQRVDSLLTLSIKLDTMSLYYDRMDFEMSNLRAGLGCQNTADSRDSTQVNPIGGSLRFDRFSFTSPDSTRIRLQDIKARTTLRRYEGNSRLPEVLAKVSANRIRYVDRLNRLSLSEGEFDLRANIKAMRQRPTSGDSAATAMRRRRAMAQSRKPRGSETLTMDLDSTTRRFIRRLNLRGSITAKRGRIFTPYFPLRNSVSDLNMAFTTDSVTFNQVRLRSGNSDFTLSGKITNIARFLASHNGAPLQIHFESHSRKIDVNRLSYAAFAGAAFAERAATVDLSDIEDETRLEEAVEETAGDDVAAIIVPVNVEASLALTADTIIYTDMALSRFNGMMQMRNGAINLSDLSARTNFGSARLTALYSAPRKRDIRFGFGMQLDSVDLKEAIGLIPSVDSLMPMMRNFAGIVNADVAATTDVDSAMNFVLPTLNAAIKLEGDSLVLLDPDTFKSVSKWLLFKKKDRNIIDHMGVELLVRNSTLELFPFMFDIDRYRLGIMGYNDMALNLNYHVSVLKSPLPFKFGINITGNTDDMKIRLGKARYNEKSAGQMVAIADTTRVNLLKQIENVFRRGAATTRLDHIKVGQRRQDFTSNTGGDTISGADSLQFIKAGILPPRNTIATH